jgi:hypothetical protein
MAHSGEEPLSERVVDILYPNLFHSIENDHSRLVAISFLAYLFENTLLLQELVEISHKKLVAKELSHKHLEVFVILHESGQKNKVLARLSIILNQGTL